MLLTYPNLNCTHCYSIEPNTPDCETPKGCPIGDLASDPELNELVDKYLEARLLYNLTNLQKTFDPTAEELGLYDDTRTFLKAETIFVKWQNKKQQEASKKTK